MSKQKQQPTEAEQVKITLTQAMAGPQGNARPGTILDVPEAKAKELLESQQARAYDAERDRKAPQGLSKAPDSWER